MSERVNKVLSRLAALGFQTREAEFAPFEERLPLVAAVAWDMATAQLALVAEMLEETEDAEWRQLLFASAGLRHHLVSDGPAAFGAPVILAVVDDGGRRRLRDIAEELAERYVLFNRVDLNLVHEDDLENAERLDDALAPLLPRCRTRQHQQISRADVDRFWTMLRGEIRGVAGALDQLFGEQRERAAHELSERLIGDDDRAAELPAPTPLDGITIREFRSIREATTPLAPVTIIHGPNGGGKSSLLEAMELVWAGTSLRKPNGVPAHEYARHLPRNGGGGFSVVADGHHVDAVSEKARAELARSVLTQDSVAALVSQSPEERYQALLATTGLEMPDLADRAQRLCDETRRTADNALVAAGLPTLRRRDTNAVQHLRRALASGFARRLPDTHELVGAEEALGTASAGAYSRRSWPTEDHARAALIRADTLIDQLLNDEMSAGALTDALDDAREQVVVLATSRRAALQPLRRLMELRRRAVPGPELNYEPESEPEPEQVPIPQQLALRWLAHANALRDAAARFGADAKSLADVAWKDQLTAYAEGLIEAAGRAPTGELEELAQRTPRLATAVPATRTPASVYLAAGFGEPVADFEAIEGATAQLIAVLERQAQGLDALAADLASHPARRFAEHADAVLGELCRFELARQMRNAGPILNASERLVAELLQTRLAPVVRELVASIVRFEWYFEPLLVPEKGRKIVLGGLATSQPDLDARLLLNAAERTALGIAWFLALHFLQPPERRQVLVLDDPTSVFDAPNQAGLISTLRAFVRLARPAQLVVSTHDDLVAAALADELAPVDGWPTASRRVRCQRNSDDCTVIVTAGENEHALSVEAEIESLGLGEPTATP